MKRVALYARFSSDLQDAKSIRDQLLVCRAEIERRGWHEIATYTDEAMSAASIVTRPGILELVRDASDGRFDVIMAEALDRFSRDLADTAQLHKQLTFYGAEIFTLSEQLVTPMHVSFKGLMGQMFLEELKRKTHRGLQGKINDGMSAGGRCYGYKPVPGSPGELIIDQAEAQVIREIHHRYAIGESPHGIMLDLNGRKIPSPRNDRWRVSAIAGQKHAGNGILNNELYIGRRIWNRRKKIVDPTTGRKRMRARPRSEWIITDVPELRILEDDEWQRTKERQEAYSRVYRSKAKRPTRLLSGLLRCGACGGPYTIVSKDRYGCSNYKDHLCKQRKTIQAQHIEIRIINAISTHLRDEAFLKEAAKNYHQTRVEAEADNTAKRNELSKQIAGVTGRLERAIDRLIDTDGDGAIAVMQKRVKELEAEQKALQTQLDALPDAPPVRLMPGAAKRFADMVARVVQAVQDMEHGEETRNALRTLVLEISLLANDAAENGMDIELKGSLAALMGGEATVGVGAGVGFEPTTFRL